MARRSGWSSRTGAASTGSSGSERFAPMERPGRGGETRTADTVAPGRKGPAMSLADAPFFASLPAHDIERAKRWYVEKLGLTPLMDLGVSGQLYRTGASLWLLYQTPSAGT